MAEWHDQCKGHELGQTLEMVRDREACCSPWSCKELDMTGQLNKNMFTTFFITGGLFEASGPSSDLLKSEFGPASRSNPALSFSLAITDNNNQGIICLVYLLLLCTFLYTQ